MAFVYTLCTQIACLLLICGCGGIECSVTTTTADSTADNASFNTTVPAGNTSTSSEIPQPQQQTTTTDGWSSNTSTSTHLTPIHQGNLSESGRQPSRNDSNAPGAAAGVGPEHGTSRPRLDYMVFQDQHKVQPTEATTTAKHTHIAMHITAQELDDYDHHLVVWVSVLGVGCFLSGMVSTSLVAYILYRRQRRKWRNVYKRRYSRARAAVPAYDIEACQQQPSNHPAKFLDTASPCSDFFRFKEGMVPTDMRTLFSNHVPTSLAEEDPHNNSHRYECQSVFPQLTTYSGDMNPFINQFSRIISSEGGEISSPYSDVAVFLTPRAIRKGTSRQIFVNVALQADLFLGEFLRHNSEDGSKLSINLKDLALENLNRNLLQLSPVVECISPGVRRFARPLAIRIPHRANISSNDPSLGWDLRVLHSSSALGDSMTWSAVPMEESRTPEQTPDAVFSFDQDSVYVRTYLPGTWAVLGRVKNKHSALRLCSVAYAQCKLPSCTSSRQGLQVISCDNQSSFPDLIVPTTSQNHCDSRSSSPGLSALRDLQKGAAAPLCMNSPDNAQQVRLTVYICDPYMDAHKRICEIEAARGSKCQSHHQSLSVYNNKDWEVTLVSTHDHSWSWSLPRGESHTKTISMEACVQCSGTAPSVDYLLEYKGRKGQDSAAGVQATFSLVQKRKDRSKMVDTYLTTYNIPLPEYTPDDMDSLYRRLSDHSIHDTDSSASSSSA